MGQQFHVPVCFRYENVSINIIYSQLSVTRGSFYHHFSNKNDLLLYWFSSQIKQNIVMDESLDLPGKL
ncbi:helix-turn-helix domain-containing protein [Paenibacillus sp. FSL P4-0081]|uniref:helix-turn-helix domain-containing protein n=1 Tax=Paenibacillus sp. FSL R10-2199 TaxID=2975348 RepID=UPI0009DEC916